MNIGTSEYSMIFQINKKEAKETIHPMLILLDSAIM